MLVSCARYRELVSAPIWGALGMAMGSLGVSRVTGLALVSSGACRRRAASGAAGQTACWACSLNT